MNRRSFIGWVAAAALFSVLPGTANAAFLAKQPALNVIIDTTATPDMATWAAEAKARMEKAYPAICKAFASKGYNPPTEVKVIFQDGDKGIAGTAGHTVYVTSKWFRDHPDDYGALVHELAHAIQAYPKYDPVWLVEGLADYARFYLYEPKGKLRPINILKASYKDSYQTTAGFLGWLEQKRKRGIVNKLNAALRNDTYTEDIFKKETGHTLDELWAEYLVYVQEQQVTQSAPK